MARSSSAPSVGPLSSVSADGGAVKEATSLLPGQTNHRWPQFLPDGRRFLLFALGAPDVRGVYLGSLADTERKPSIRIRDSGYAFIPPAHVLFARQGALWARTLNRECTHADGELLPVAPRVLVARSAHGFGAFSASSVGSIAYRASAGETQLVWLDRAGRPVGASGAARRYPTDLSHLSPMGAQWPSQRTVDGNTDVWLIDTERGASRRLTFDPATDGDPIFSPDGSRIAYRVRRKGRRVGHVRTAFRWHRRRDSAARIRREQESLAMVSRWPLHPLSSQNSMTDTTYGHCPSLVSANRFEVARTPFGEYRRQVLSGRTLGRRSNRPRRDRPRSTCSRSLAPGPNRRFRLGEAAPRWRRDGRELFYLAPDNRLMAVSIAQRGSVLDAAPSHALFTLPTLLAYEPSPDGQRFLVNTVGFRRRRRSPSSSTGSRPLLSPDRNGASGAARRILTQEGTPVTPMRVLMTCLTALIAVLPLTLFPALRAAQNSEATRYWPQWRGPHANGVSLTANPSARMERDEKHPLEGGDPRPRLVDAVVWGDRLFVTTAVPVGVTGDAQHAPRGGLKPRGVHRFVVMAIDRKTGRTVWERVAANRSRTKRATRQQHLGLELRHHRRPERLRVFRVVRPVRVRHERQAALAERPRRQADEEPVR